MYIHIGLSISSVRPSTIFQFSLSPCVCLSCYLSVSVKTYLAFRKDIWHFLESILKHIPTKSHLKLKTGWSVSPSVPSFPIENRIFSLTCATFRSQFPSLNFSQSPLPPSFPLPFQSSSEKSRLPKRRQPERTKQDAVSKGKSSYTESE